MNGLGRLTTGNSYAVVTSDQDLPGSEIRSLHEDREGNIDNEFQPLALGMQREESSNVPNDRPQIDIDYLEYELAQPMRLSSLKRGKCPSNSR